MAERQHEVGVPSRVLIPPTLMLTGRSAAAVYAQPAAELKRLLDAGAVQKVAHGYYFAVPLSKRGTDWQPSIETLAAGLAAAIYGHGRGAIWGLSAARTHGALPRAISTAFLLGPRQHRPIELKARAGRVEFRKRDPDRLDLEYLATELGPALVTSIDQTILDLSAQPFLPEDEMRAGAVRTLMTMTVPERLADLAERVRGRTALGRAKGLVVDADR